MKRILIWSPNYAPELTGIPPLVTDLATWLAKRGHQVDVVTAMPNYPERRIHPDYRGALWKSETIDGVDVHRSWLRVRPEESFRDKALYELSFATASLPLALRRLARTDVLVCVVPTLASALAAATIVRALRVAGRGPRLVLWLQDLVLSAAQALDGVGRGARSLLTAAQAAEKAAARASDSVIVCSPGFGRYLSDRGLDERRILMISNWVDTAWITPQWNTNTNGQTTFLYAGNLGYTQGFETLIEAARLVEPTIQLEIVGAGNAARHVRELAAGSENICVRQPVPRSQFPSLLAAADAHIVLQRRISAGANLPSKIGSYLASGRPIVASIELETPAAKLLEATGAAILVPPESPRKLAAAMTRLHEHPELRLDLARKGRSFAVRKLSRETTLARFEQAIIG